MAIAKKGFRVLCSGDFSNIMDPSEMLGIQRDCEGAVLMLDCLGKLKETPASENCCGQARAEGL